MIIKFKKLFI